MTVEELEAAEERATDIERGENVPLPGAQFSRERTQRYPRSPPIDGDDRGRPASQLRRLTSVGLASHHLSRGVVLFTASTHSRQEIEDLAAEARRLRPDVEIFIARRSGAAYRYE
jgi:hypothetical protein